jgi:hypothetical protein
MHLSDLLQFMFMFSTSRHAKMRWHMQINQLPTKSHAELEDNSIIAFKIDGLPRIAQARRFVNNRSSLFFGSRKLILTYWLYHSFPNSTSFKNNSF